MGGGTSRPAPAAAAVDTKPGPTAADAAPTTTAASDEQPPQALDFDAVVATPEGQQQMLSFAKREQSEENMLFFLDVQKYNQATDEATRAEVGEVIVSTYLCKGAALPVNLPATVTTRFTGDPIKNIPAGQYEYSPDLFGPAEGEIRKLLRQDTFSRFESSPEASTLLRELGQRVVRAQRVTRE
jgi:hypothetical protein